MDLFSDAPLPPGLWLVKGIDRCEFGNGQSTSVTTSVFLNRMSKDVPAVIDPETLWTAYGYGPGVGNEQEDHIVRKLLIGNIAQLRIGDVCAGTRRLASLAVPGPSLRVSPKNNWLPSTFSVIDERKAYWPVNSKSMEGAVKAIQARRAVAQHTGSADSIDYCPTAYSLVRDGIEYILPALVILQTFYAVDSRLINALYNGPWQDKAKDLLMFDNDSGANTDATPHEGPWTIVLRAGFPQRLVLPLALLWLHPEGRRQADLMHKRALEETQENQATRSRRYWSINADFPFDAKQAPWSLGIDGLMLPAAEDGTSRFIITAITQVTWPLKDQVIEWAIAGEKSKGDRDQENDAEPSDGSGWPARQPVDGDPDAIHTSVEDPDPSKSQNRFEGQTLEFLDPPPLIHRPSQSTKKTRESTAIPIPGVPSKRVSAGTPGSRTETAPAQAIHTYRDANTSSQQFSLLLQALEALKRDPRSSVDDFEDVAPDLAHEDYRLMRQGRKCWSLLKDAHRQSGRMPSTGWEVVRPKSRGTDRPSFVPFRRCVWVVRVQVKGRDLMLLEIEFRPGDLDGFRMIALPLRVGWTQDDVATAIAAIRINEGKFTAKKLQSAFDCLTPRKVSIHRHEYDRKASTPKSGKDLNIDWLGAWLQQAATR